MSGISINALDIRLGGTAIISQLDLQVQAGEFLVLLGPSGCGKSTLLHSIAGFIEVSSGSIAIGGQDVTWADPKDRGIGMVFQSYALYPTMTVEKNMAFGPKIAGVPRAEIKKRVDRVAGMLHLEELLQRKPANLSGGQRQRVAIGRALVREAEVLLFDEPLSNLDAKLRSVLRRELKELHAKLGATMVYVTHDQVEAMTLANRIAVMRNGAIQQIDTPAAVYGKPANVYVAGFLGSPTMNFIKGQLKRDTAGWRFVHPRLQLDLSGYEFASAPQAGQPVIMGVRPEDITVQTSPGGSFASEVRLVEPMGSNQVLWLALQDLDLGVIADATLVAPAGTQVYASINASRVSLFDAGTEERI
ncbi:ABC transporter ATP-binding protein [Paucibacter sp. M5-1]|uniref:ABC transporter ATP-binding protein n=1 Tax=Paucibacter sp. M5-1 TaxID=3015998 RepID=UPI0022B85F13|nr:ABC transporter ATP-binding protein [Paucibacter sp. M5-1]MCZ7883044.1 ABC transporter ATP-binding protein [Paucibacter sp. M5-1]